MLQYTRIDQVSGGGGGGLEAAVKNLRFQGNVDCNLCVSVSMGTHGHS